ncbi:MAG: hypothetical protein ACLS3M_02470 [Collinsella sp.]
MPISFDFSDSTDEYFEQIAPFVTYAFMSMGDASLEDIKAKLEWVKALGPQIVCASRGSRVRRLTAKTSASRASARGARGAQTHGGRRFTADGVFGHYLPRRGRRVRQRPQFASLDFAAGFAAQTCKIEGSWGHRWSTRTSFLSWQGCLGAPRIALGVKMSVRACAAGFCRADVLPESGSLGCIQGASQERFEGCFLSI